MDCRIYTAQYLLFKQYILYFHKQSERQQNSCEFEFDFGGDANVYFTRPFGHMAENKDALFTLNMLFHHLYLFIFFIICICYVYFTFSATWQKHRHRISPVACHKLSLLSLSKLLSKYNFYHYKIKCSSSSSFSSILSISSTSIHSYPFFYSFSSISYTFIHFHLPSSIFIHFIHFYPL